MFPTSATTTQIIKAAMGIDLRRLTVELPTGTSAAEAMVAIKGAIARGFQLPGPDTCDLSLKYADEEGDLCTLTEHTLDDLAAMAGARPWRLQVQQHIPTSSSTAAKARNVNATGPSETEPAAQEPEWESKSQETGEKGHGMDEQQASMALMFLPLAAGLAQSEAMRSKLNSAGLEEREAFLPVCKQLVGFLDIVPESTHVRPMMEAYIDGSDTGHLGDLTAALLNAWSSAESKEAVKLVLQSLDITSLKALGHHANMFGQLGKGNKGNGKGPGKQDFWRTMQHHLHHHREHMQQHQAVAGPWGAMPPMGGIPGQGMAQMWQGMLGNLLGGKGLGKGWPLWPAERSAEQPVEQHTAAATGSSAAGAQAEVAHSELDFDADTLLEMGLVSDREVAKGLLRAHNGDISQVVATLTA